MQRPFLFFCFLYLTTPSIGKEISDSQVLTQDESELIELTNAERVKAHLPKLKMSWKLMHAARDHSWHMAFHDELAHELKNKTLINRMNEAGYDYTHAGENIAYSHKALHHVVQGWMKSPGHRKNILNRDFKDMGVGMALSQTGKKYFTQVFGAGDE